jgi:fibronectin-binding autotransporter adhesin
MKSNKLTSIVATIGIFLSSISTSQVLPGGYIGTVTNNTPNTWQSYSYSFTPNISGTNYVGFAFRQDPAFWTFDNASLTASGSQTNLLTNGGFTSGGAINITTSNGPGTIQAPTNWGVWYQNGTYPAAAGTWQDIGGSHGGVWYDGAVGTFDGIYQGISLLAGTTYTLSFEVSGNHTSNGGSVQLGVYAGPCADTSIAASSCTIPSSAGFTTLATPAEGAAAGNPTPTVVSTTNGPDTVSSSSARGATTTTTTSTRGVTNAVATTTLTPTRQEQILSVNRNITTVATTPITTVVRNTTPITTTTVTTPTTIQTWSDGSTTTVNGSPVTTTSVVNEILTATTTTNEVITTADNKAFTTRIDQLAKLDKISTLQNENSLADPLSRNKVANDKITNRSDPKKESTVYVTGYSLRSGTQDTYKYTTNVFGIGYEEK